MISLLDHQKKAVDELRSGSILCGGVGTGKSITALAYYYSKICNGEIDPIGPMKKPTDLYIITTARKRDTLEWDAECIKIGLSRDSETNQSGVKVVIDSWNNIAKYVEVKDAFFIFDEQRLVGNGAWVKSFLKISRTNQWILLTATPGDTWVDYIPVFLANGFYKNRTEFYKRHVVFDRFAKYPKIKYYINVNRLIGLKDRITVRMDYEKPAEPVRLDILMSYDTAKYSETVKTRWNFEKDKPIESPTELCGLLRKICNSGPERLDELLKIFKRHKKVIVFYNFDYELEILRNFAGKEALIFAEWNGHKHEPIPKSDTWLYFVQYTSGSEGWNCIETDCIVFFSLSYSYRVMTQAAGRIDRLNTPFDHLYYYYFKTASPIDKAIDRAIKCKKEFNERNFVETLDI